MTATSVPVTYLLDAKGFPFGTQVESIFTVLDSNTDPYAYVTAINLHRRHLTAEQREETLFKLIAHAPQKSDRQIAKEIGVDHKTIGRARAKGEDVGRIPHVTTRTDTAGRQQPARKAAAKSPPVSEDGESVSVVEIKQTIAEAKGRRVPSSAAIFRTEKLGAATVAALEGTTLASAREQDELVFLNRGAASGELTDIVKEFVEAAVAARLCPPLPTPRAGPHSAARRSAPATALASANACTLASKKCKLSSSILKIRTPRSAARPRTCG